MQIPCEIVKLLDSVFKVYWWLGTLHHNTRLTLQHANSCFELVVKILVYCPAKL